MNKIILTLLCVAAISVPQIASAQTQAFDYLGQADLPDQVGGNLSMYGIITDSAPTLVPPLPLDFANYQYTVVVTDLRLDTDGDQQSYSGGGIAIYEDNSTAADYANLSTFVDGEAILVGVVPSLTRTVTTLPFPPFSATSVLGRVDWTGGTRVHYFAPGDELDWLILAGGNTDPADIEPGFDEQWDGKVEPKEPVVDNDETSVGSFKLQFRN